MLPVKTMPSKYGFLDTFLGKLGMFLLLLLLGYIVTVKVLVLLSSDTDPLTWVN